uniref:Ig-like domain-containing protein n=1 Tax=Callorhinchus milii TaxID=7868 RepID=A0A4W3GDU2_CALMI
IIRCVEQGNLPKVSPCGELNLGFSLGSDVYWYRQLPGQQREWILTHDTNGRKTDHEDVNQRLQPSRVTSNNTYILILRRVTVSDAAVYQCCVWGDVCGNGTRLNVTSE